MLEVCWKWKECYRCDRNAQNVAGVVGVHRVLECVKCVGRAQNVSDVVKMHRLLEVLGVFGMQRLL